jgi:hypothetical protein
MKVRGLLMLAVFGFFTVSAVMRLVATPGAWWNWGALALALSVPALIGVVAWRRKGRPPAKPRWFHFRAGGSAAVAIVALLCWWVIRVPAPMGSGPAGAPVDAALFAGVWSERKVELLSIGDSVSTGYGAGKGLGYFELIRQNNDEVYPEMAGVELSRTLPNLSVTRRASNSSNSIAHEQVIERMAVREPDVFGIVCLTTGGIDLIHWYGRRDPVEGTMYGASWTQAEPWIANFSARLDRMMLALQSKFPGGCAVFIATIYDPTDTVGDIENAGPMFWLPAWPDGKAVHTAFNDAIRATAKKHEHVHLVDVYAAMLGHGIHCADRTNPHYDADDPTYWYFENLEDPNQRGYDAIRRAFLNVIGPVLRAELD